MRLAAAAVSVLLFLTTPAPGRTSPVKAVVSPVNALGDLSEAAALRALRELGANIRAKVAAQVRVPKHPGLPALCLRLSQASSSVSVRQCLLLCRACTNRRRPPLRVEEQVK